MLRNKAIEFSRLIVQYSWVREEFVLNHIKQISLRDKDH